MLVGEDNSGDGDGQAGRKGRRVTRETREEEGEWEMVVEGKDEVEVGVRREESSKGCQSSEFNRE